MKKLIALAAVAMLGACNTTVDIKYSQDDENSCEYVEKYKERGNLLSTFASYNDVITRVYYDGVKCDKVIEADLARGASKNAMFKVVRNGADVVIQK
ncbi:MAG: hypothetical protein LBB23_03830 [Rickettsiales bacterium]|jgi:hypothetical protein|nr:hypothetical protein [Rickettsiales bacterium]